MDKFPEAFRRFESKVNVRQITTFKQLEISFEGWAGGKWAGTSRQKEALAIEAHRLGIETKETEKSNEYHRIEQQFNEYNRQQFDEAVFFAPQEKFSVKYSSFNKWQTQKLRTTAYQRRISNYLRNHPNATLTEARGHRAKR